MSAFAARKSGPGQGQGGRGGSGGRGRGRSGSGGRGGGRGRQREVKKYSETVVRIARNAKVVKGGRRFSFAAEVVVGDGKGKVGIGHGKANGVPIAVEKGVKAATKNIFKVPLVNGGTIPHAIKGRFGASNVHMFPAAPGTGVIAGAAVKAVLVAAGYKNILTKVHGSTNPTNVLKATRNALQNLRTREQVEALRGVKLDPYHWPKVADAKRGEEEDKAREAVLAKKLEEEKSAAKGKKKPAAKGKKKGDAKAKSKAAAPKSEGEAEAKSGGEAEAKSEGKAEAKSEAKAEAKSEAKPVEKSEAKPVEKSEAKAEAKSEAKPEAKSEAKPVEKSEAKPVEKSEAKPVEKAEETEEKKG